MALSAATLEASAAADESITSGWDLDIQLVEQIDPARIVTMTDDGCGNTCEGSTCISAV